MKKLIAVLLTLAMLAGLLPCVFAADDELGVYELVYAEMYGMTMLPDDIGSISVELMKKSKCVLTLNGEVEEGAWTHKGTVLKICDANGEEATGTLKNGVMTIAMEGAKLVLVSTSAPEKTKQMLALAPDWQNSWYGFWMVNEGTGDYEDWYGYYWDVLGETSLSPEGYLNMIIWDEDTSRSEPLSELVLEMIENDGEYYAVSKCGHFFGQEVGEGDIVFYNNIDGYGKMIVFDSFLIEGESGTIDASMYIEPWFSFWDEEEAENDWLPRSFDWYSESIAQGMLMPETIGGTAPMILDEAEPVTEPASGEMLMGYYYPWISELTIDASGSKDNVLVKLKTADGADVCKFYVKAGDNITVEVPALELYAYFAEGREWMGEELLFGEKTAFSKDKEVCDFNEYSYTYTMYKTDGGTFVPADIDESDF